MAAPAGVVAVVLSPLNARLSNLIDIRWLASFSQGPFGVSFLMRTSYTSDTDLWQFILPLLVQSMAMDVFFISLTTICIDKLPPHRIPSATGLTNFARITGGAFAATATFWDRREIFRQSRLAEAANMGNPAYDAAVAQMQRVGIDHAHATGVMTQELIHQPIRRPAAPSGPIAVV